MLRWLIQREFFVLFRRIKLRCSRSLVRHVWPRSIRHRWKQTIELRSAHAIKRIVNGSGGSIKLLGEISDCFLLGLPWRIGRTSCTISRFPCRRRWWNEVWLTYFKFSFIPFRTLHLITDTSWILCLLSMFNSLICHRQNSALSLNHFVPVAKLSKKYWWRRLKRTKSGLIQLISRARR